MSTKDELKALGERYLEWTDSEGGRRLPLFLGFVFPLLLALLSALNCPQSA